MNEKKPVDRAEVISRRTQLLRQAAIARIDLVRDFMNIYPDYDPNTDMTAEQEAAWDSLSEEPLAQIHAKLDELE